MEQGKTPYHSILKSRQTLHVCFGQTVTELRTSMPARSVLRTYTQYSVTFCSRLEISGGVIPGVAFEYVGMNAHAQFWRILINSGINISIFGQSDPVCALLCSIQLHFAADLQQLARTDVDVHVKFGNSKSSRCRDIRAAHVDEQNVNNVGYCSF